jgi:RNA recognition motif-containing protein
MVTQSRFKGFGPVKYARIVVDSTTGRSRGTGFVCFYRDEDAQKVLKTSDTLTERNESTSVRVRLASGHRLIRLRHQIRFQNPR